MEAILPNVKVLIVQVLTFVLGMGAIWKLYIVSLRDHLKARREGIVKELAGADAARAEAERLRGELALERARMAEEMRQAKLGARDEAAALRTELLAKAAEQQEALIKQARERIDGEARRALAEIRVQAAALVLEAAGALIAKKLDSGADRALAERLVAAVKPSKN